MMSIILRLQFYTCFPTTSTSMTLLEFNGLALNRCFVPPFTVSESEWVHVAAHILPPEDTAYLFDLLARRVQHESVFFHQRVSVASARTEYGRWLRKTVQSYVESVLAEHRGEAVAIIESLGLNPKEILGRYAGTPKMLIELKLAFRLGKIVVFDDGFSPADNDQISKVVKEHLDQSAVLQVHFACLSPHGAANEKWVEVTPSIEG